MVLIAGNIGIPISNELFSYEEYLLREEQSLTKNNYYNGLK